MGEWEKDTFVQCGVRVVQKPDFSIELDLCDYAQELAEIKIKPQRALKKKLP